MSGVEVRQMVWDEAPLIAGFIDGENRAPTRRCLHTYAETGWAAVWEQAKRRPDHEFTVLLAYRGPRLIGAMALDVQPASGRAWAWGPFAPARGMVACADALIQAGRAWAGPRVKRVSFYPDIRNKRMIYFLLGLGAETRNPVHVLRHGRSKRPLPFVEGTRPFTAPDQAAISALHDREFPNTWATADQMAAADGDVAALIVGEAPGGAPAGYAYVTRDHDRAAATLGFLAVEQASRGQGWGERLTKAALHWAYQDEKTRAVNLTVDDANKSARQVYTACGFKPEITGRPMDLHWIGTP